MESKKPKILHVEDNDIILKLMKRILSDDFELKQSSTLEDALSIIQNKDFDVYISDGDYPSRGKESWKILYDSIKKINPSANFIVFSGDYGICERAESLKIKAFRKADMKDIFVIPDYIKKILKYQKNSERF